MTRIDLDVLAEFCTLPDVELAARQEELRTTLLPEVLRSERTPTGMTLEFDAALRSQLDELVAFERKCCPGIDWLLEEAEDRVRLVIAGL